MMKDDEWEDKWEDFRDKAFKWWDTITLIVIIVTIIVTVIFTIKHNDEGQGICAIILGIAIGLKAGNLFARGGGKPF